MAGGVCKESYPPLCVRAVEQVRVGVFWFVIAVVSAPRRPGRGKGELVGVVDQRSRMAYATVRSAR